MTPWTVVGALAAGAALCSLVVWRPPRALVRGRHAKENYRGRIVAGTLGGVLAVPLAAGGVLGLASGDDGALVVCGAGLGLGVLGLVDDLYGSGADRGLRGHLRALVRGRVTTGLVKAVAGVVVGLVAAWALGERGTWIVLGGALVALAANLANLLDVRPGRACKAWLLAWGASLCAGPPAGALLACAALAGGVAAFLSADLRERGMLGDAGASLVGGALGVVAVASLGHAGQAACVAVLGALTLASEVWSFTSVIARVPPLRWVDRLGRLPEE